jgi:hypothetical protein
MIVRQACTWPSNSHFKNIIPEGNENNKAQNLITRHHKHTGPITLAARTKA